MLLMSGSSIDASAMNDGLQSDHEGPFDPVGGSETLAEQFTDTTSPHSRLTEMFFSSKQQRRSLSVNQPDLVGRDVQEFEARQLLSATVAGDQLGFEVAVDGDTDDHPGDPSLVTEVVELNPDTLQWVLQGSLQTTDDVDVFAIRIDRPAVMYLNARSLHVRFDFIGEQPTVNGPLLELSEGTYHIQVRQSGLPNSEPYTIELALDESSTPSVRPEQPFAPNLPDDHPDEIDSSLTPVPFDADELLWRFQGVIASYEDRDVLMIQVEETVEASFRPGTNGVTNSIRIGFLGEQPGTNGPLWVLTPGTWYVQLEAMESSNGNVYDFELALDRLSLPQDPSDDHPNVITANMTPISFDPVQGQWDFNGTLSDRHDIDVFAIVVDEAMEVGLDQISPNVIAKFVGTQPGEAGPNYGLTPGTWYIQISPAGASDGGDYQVGLVDYNPGPPVAPPYTIPDKPPGYYLPGEQPLGDDPPDIQSGVRFVSYDRNSQAWEFTGEIEDVLDRDVVGVYVGEDVKVSFSGPSHSGFFGQQPDLVGDGQYLLTRGVWYLQAAGGPEFESGNYTVTLSADDYDPTSGESLSVGDPGDATPNVVLLNTESDGTSGRVSGQVTGTGDTQWFQFEVHERSQLRVDTDFTGRVRVLGATGETIADSVDAEMLTELPKGLYYLALADSAAVGDFQLSVALDSIYANSVEINERPENSLSNRPEFHWVAPGTDGHYEIFIGYRGQAEAVYRTSGITADSFQVPDSLAAGPYVAWVRWHSSDGQISRWGIGRDFVVAETPSVSIQDHVVTWNAVTGANNYEIQINEIASDGSYVQQDIIRASDLVNNQFAIPDDLQGKRLAVWVRAIQQTDDGQGQTAWSKVATTHVVEYQEAIDFSLDRGLYTLDVVLPSATLPSTGSGSSSLEVFVQIPDQPEKIFRVQLTELTARGQQGVGQVVLPDEFAQFPDSLRVWVREIGSGLQQSRWGAGQLTEPPAIVIVINEVPVT